MARHARRGLIGFLSGVLAFSLLAADEAGAADDIVVFDGGGWGHSVGLSQYGALGMSQEGSSFDEILTHYFTGTAVATLNDDLAARTFWVNLTMEDPSLTFTVRGIDVNPVPATFTIGERAVVVAPGQAATITRLANGTCSLTSPTGTFSGPCAIDVEWDGWTGSPATAIAIEGCGLVNWNAPGGSRVQTCTYARGGLRIRPDNNTNTIDVSVEIGIEDYVLGISEMPYGWAGIGGEAALQAQAVAARSYVYGRARWRGDAEDRPWCWCQVYDTHYDQTYVGWGHGTDDWVAAVEATAGMILTHPTVTSGGQLVPIETFYSSSTAGRTENSEDAFTATVPYLRSVDDHWSQAAAVGNPHARWSRQYTTAELAAHVTGLSAVTDAWITRCSISGAALEVAFSGPEGTITSHTRNLRGSLHLRSQQILSITTPRGSSRCVDGVPVIEGPVPSTTTTSTAPAPTTTTTLPPVSTTTTVPGTTTTTTVPTTTVTTTVPTTTTTTTVPTTTVSTFPPVSTTTTVPGTTTTTTAAPSEPATCAADDISIDALLSSQRTLQLGSQGEDVRDVQKLLAALALYDGAADGIFGQRTTAAVRSFQDARGLTVDGIVGSRTRGELASLLGAAEHRRVLTSDGSLLRRGISGDVVRALQAVLSILGYDPGPVDGIYGSRTTQAVQQFQTQQNLLVDGIVGEQSRAALTAALDLYELTTCG